MDCYTPLESVINHCLNTGINCLAISDHNTIAGALKLQEIAPFKVIVAEEIKTSIGELVGFFLTEEIPKGLSPEETIAQIRKQGGLIGIPHPFGRVPFLSWRAVRSYHCAPFVRCHSERSEESRPGPSPRNNLLSPEILAQIDIIEVFNSRTPFPSGSTKARRLAQDYGLAASAGSDAHTVAEIGRAYVEMPEFSSPGDFLDSLAQGVIFGHRSSPLVHLASTWAKVKRCFRGV